MRLLVLLALVLSSLFVLPAPANAECRTVPVETTRPDGSVEIVMREVCDDDGEPGGGGGEGGTGCYWNVEEVACRDGGEVWFNTYGCYASPTDSWDNLRGNPGPPWRGHEDGGIWICHGMGPTKMDVGTPLFFWVGGTDAPVDGETVTREALGRLGLVTPNIQIAPGPPATSYVGLETWFWMDPTQWRRLSASVSVPTATVTVTAEPVRVRWGLADGEISCDSAGTPWIQDMGATATTDCSHTFRTVSSSEPNGEFAVTAAIAYQVDWACSGNCVSASGSLGEVPGPAGTSAIAVGEIQSIVTRVGPAQP